MHSLSGPDVCFRLARPADEITVGAVIRKAMNSLNLVKCFKSETKNYPLIIEYHLKRLLTCALSALLTETDRVTIADISANHLQLLALLSPLIDSLLGAKIHFAAQLIQTDVRQGYPASPISSGSNGYAVRFS